MMLQDAELIAQIVYYMATPFAMIGTWIIGYWTYRNHKTIARVETNTNSLTAHLVKVTAESERAIGLKQGRSEVAAADTPDVIVQPKKE